MKLEFYGEALAMNGNELWVNAHTDEPIKLTIKDSDSRNKLYCKKVKVTIEEVENSEWQNLNNG